MKVEMIYLSQEGVIHCGGMSMDKAIDDWETDKHRMGDTMAYMFRDGKIDDSRIDASVSDLVAGRKSGHDNDDQLTYTCNVGLGLYDVAIAVRVYQYAKENGIGQKLKLSLPTFWTGPLFSGPVHIFSRQSSRGDAPAREFCLYRGRFREYNGCR